MRRVLAICAAVIGMAAGALAPTASAATAAVTLSPVSGHPSVTTTVTGTGFGASEAVDVYFDTTDEQLAVTSATGGFSASLTVPANAAPGVHWITAVGRKDGAAAQAKFIVRTNWPEFGGLDTRGQRANPYENTLTASTVSGLDEAWHFDPGAAMTSSPAVVNGIVYIGSDNGTLYAVNASSGTLKWTTAVGGHVYSSPAVIGGVVYFGSTNGHVYALNATTGVQKWDDNLSSLEPSGFAGSPTVWQGTVYIGGVSGNVYYLNAATGFANHTVTTGGEVGSAPAVANGVLYVESGDEKLYAFDPATGASKWTTTLDTGFVSGLVLPGPAVSNGRVLVDDFAGNDFALRVKGGGMIWSQAGDGTYLASPAVSGGVAYFADEGGALIARQAASGANPWTGIGLAFGGSPTVAGGVVYTGDFDGIVFAFRQSDGTFLWSGQVGTSSESSPVVSDGTLYVGADDGLHAFSLGTVGAAAVSRPAPARLHPNLKLQPTG